MSDRRRLDMPGGSMDDFIQELDRRGHVSPAQRRAYIAFCSDFRAYHGRSAGLVGDTSPKVQTGASERIWPTGGPPGWVEMDVILNKRLRRHERHLMRRLVVGKEMARGTLADLGRLFSGYKTAKTREAFAAGMICGFLNSLVEIYEPG